jgi:hypothetical protein
MLVLVVIIEFMEDKEIIEADIIIAVQAGQEVLLEEMIIDAIQPDQEVQ